MRLHDAAPARMRADDTELVVCGVEVDAARTDRTGLECGECPAIDFCVDDLRSLGEKRGEAVLDELRVFYEVGGGVALLAVGFGDFIEGFESSVAALGGGPRCI